MLRHIIRKIIKANPNLDLDLKKSYSKLTPFSYVYQTIFLAFLLSFSISFIILIVMINKFGQYVFFGLIIFITLYYIFFKFFFSYNSVKIKQIEREQDNDLLFILEFLLVDLKSGSNLGMSIENLSKIKRPTSRFFKNILLDIKIGTDIENSIKNSINYCASYNLKVIMKRIYDSLEIGGNLDLTIENQIKEFSQKKIIKIKGYSKKINPLVTVYLLLGIVLPSLGITFFIVGATVLNITPSFLGLILSVIFVIMFFLQYLFYSFFRFQKETL